MVRDSITEPWRETTWEEAIEFAASRLKTIQDEHGVDSIGGITSSRCTNEEVYVVQKMIRAAFGNNNVDTCARVCHSPTGYGLKQTFGTSAGTQDFASVEESDLIVVIGANPTDAHPVFASRMKKRLREGASLIVIDPRASTSCAPHTSTRPTTCSCCRARTSPSSTRSATSSRPRASIDRAFVAERCDPASFAAWEEFIRLPENSPEHLADQTGVPADLVRAAARAYAAAPNAAIYYGLGVTEHSQGSTMVMAIANLAMATGNIGRRGVGVNPLRGQNNVQGSCDMGSFPHELPGYRHVSDDTVRHLFEGAWGTGLRADPGLRIPNMLDAATIGTFRAIYIQGEDLAQSDPEHHARQGRPRRHGPRHRPGPLPQRDRRLRARLPARAPPSSRRTARSPTPSAASTASARSWPAAPGKSEWEVTCDLATAMGYPMHYDTSAQIMDEIAALTPTFAGVSFDLLDRVGSVQWPCNEAAPLGTPIMHEDHFVRGLGNFVTTPYVPTDERTTRKYPLLLTTGRILSQYNVGAQTRRTANVTWHQEDVLDMHEADAELRGIADGSWAEVSSRAGATSMRVRISDEVPPGVVYTTFHHPVSGANVVTTDNSDWATNCPEYKVTAVEVRPNAGAGHPAAARRPRVRRYAPA